MFGSKARRIRELEGLEGAYQAQVFKWKHRCEWLERVVKKAQDETRAYFKTWEDPKDER